MAPVRARERRIHVLQPAAVLKKHLAEALQEEEAKNRAAGKAFVSRVRKKELKELYTSRLLKQTEPVPAAVDVAVNMATGIVMVSSVSGSQLELFEQYFASSFGVKAERILVDVAEGQNLLAAVYENGLTVPVDGHEFRLEEAGQAALVHPETGASVNSKDEATAIDKARQAGLVFSRLKLRLVRVDDDVLEWEFCLASDGSITGLKTPKVENGDGEDADAVILEKLYLIGQVVDVLLALFRNGK